LKLDAKDAIRSNGYIAAPEVTRIGANVTIFGRDGNQVVCIDSDVATRNVASCGVGRDATAISQDYIPRAQIDIAPAPRSICPNSALVVEIDLIGINEQRPGTACAGTADRYLGLVLNVEGVGCEI
jgi:hypothetical protein